MVRALVVARAAAMARSGVKEAARARAAVVVVAVALAVAVAIKMAAVTAAAV